jgi:hypothetical protein
MKTITNTDFFSDQVEIKPTTTTNHAFIAPMIKGSSLMLKDYISELQSHLEAMKLVVSDDPEVKDIRVSWVMENGVLSLKVFGTKSWTTEKIAAFEEAAQNEKTEVDQMRLLIGKYPEKAAALLERMVDSQKTETLE